MLLVILGLAVPCNAVAGETVVSLTFDDGSADQYAARSILSSRGMRGTFYINSGMVGSSSYYMTWAQIDAIQADGNEIGGHTVSHPRLISLASAEAQREVCDDRTNLTSRYGSRQPGGITSFAYPFAEYNTTTQTIVKGCGYTSGRAVGNGPESIPPRDPYATRTPPGVTPSTSVSTMQGWVTSAEQAGGGWVEIVLHNVCDNACTSNAISPANLDQFVTWLQGEVTSGRAAVKTVQQVVDGQLVSPPPPAPTDTTPPTVAIESPANGSTLPLGKVRIRASASDAGSGVAHVRFLVDGAALTTDSTSPYEVTWNSRKSRPGSHTLTAVAVDGASNSATSPPVTVHLK